MLQEKKETCRKSGGWWLFGCSGWSKRREKKPQKRQQETMILRFEKKDKNVGNNSPVVFFS